jgi:hypothetical protein
MAKRYSHTEKYVADWFLKLSKNGKLLYYYLIENCDHAGFYSIGLVHISMCIDLNPHDVEYSLNELEDKIVWSDDKTMIWIRDFLQDQANIPLNKYNNAHKGAISRIKHHYTKFQKNIDLFNSLPCLHKFKDGTEKQETLADFFNTKPGDFSSGDKTNNHEPMSNQSQEDNPPF